MSVYYYKFKNYGKTSRYECDRARNTEKPIDPYIHVCVYYVCTYCTLYVAHSSDFYAAIEVCWY